MKNLLLIFCTVLGVASVKGQNLVPNPSFELYDTCPNAQDQIEYATGWHKYSEWLTTPDYFNACNAGGPAGVPNNFGFHHSAYQGNAYAAVVTVASYIGYYREYIGIQLTQPLVVGQKYYLSFRTILGFPTYGNCPSNNIGMLLSTLPNNPSYPITTGNFAHLYSPAIITDSVNWVHLSTSIIADSAYNHCIIGNFFDDINTDTIMLDSNSVLSYYAVDLICVSTDSLICNGTEGIPDLSDNIAIVISPNPFSTFFTITNSSHYPYDMVIYDEIGKAIVRKTIDEQLKTIEMAGYPSGIYLVQVKFKNKIYSQKVIKN